MKPPLRIATGIAAFVMVASLLVMMSCLNRKAKSTTELRSVTVLKRSPAETLDLPILRSFGFKATVTERELTVPLPEGGVQTAVALGSLEIPVEGAFATEAQNLIPLYSSAAQSKTKMSETGLSYELKDFLSPALQAGVNHEIRFANAAVKLSSTDALLSLLMSDGRSVRFLSFPDDALTALLLDGASFRSVGELLPSVKAIQSSRRERNSGFAVGDFLVVTEDGVLKHTALWLDHDVYFEALPFGRSVLFRLASYSQVLSELSLRSSVEIQGMRMMGLRRLAGWNELAQRVKGIKGLAQIAAGEVNQDARGRGVFVSTSEYSVTPRLRVPAAGGEFRPNSPK